LTVQMEEIQNTIFGIIYIDGEKTSITTNMGNDWQAWMIVREIYSNALDEGGEHYEVTEEIEGAKGRTEFYLQLTPEILSVYNSWDKYFNLHAEPMYTCKHGSLYPASGKLRVFKQGILIKEYEHESVFNYDVTNASLNELREYTGSLEYDMTSIIQDANKDTITYMLEVMKEKDYEATADYTDWLGTPKFGEGWREAIGNSLIIHQKAIDNIKARGLDIDTAATVTVPERLYKALTKKFKGIGALRVADKVNEFYEVHDEALKVMTKEAVTILEHCGYMLHPELSIIYGFFGDKRILAKVSMDDKVIMISESMKNSSIHEMCEMLIEENEHFNTGFVDCSRDFQTHFIKLYTKTLFEKHKIQL